MSENEKLPSANPYTILIAEDDEFLSRVLVDKLEKAHFTIITALDGEEAIKKTTEGKIDLIILDIIMPKKTGFDVIDAVKNNLQTKDIPILVFSNLGQESDIETAMKKGAAGYFIKANMSLVSVVEKINECLNIK
jgi:CheY-like chemotaxis protein